ncbi:hypothetical protein N007_05040 [Alicyclobacillus acidoterrestris ATCC 49025]|nr:hypothetical protein N007_05040 [Alicyclobacillus acidoterrestris ATCC 49025]
MVSFIQSGLASIGKKITDYSSSSVIGVILAAIASVVDELTTAISVAQQQAYLATATGTNLDNKANDFGITRKQATYAQWTFVATKEVPSQSIITIPAGSLITTQPDSSGTGITYTVDTDTQLPIGSTKVNIPVTCTVAGTQGNIAVGTQLLWASAVPGIDGVEFDDSSNGTPAIDTETDDALRARALAAFKGLSISTTNWYTSTAESVTGVSSALVVPQGRGPGTVDIYIVGDGNTVPSDTIIANTQTVIDAGRVITDDAKVFAPSPVSVDVTMTIKATAGYDPDETAVQVQTAIENYISGLGIGGGINGTLYVSQLQAVALGVTGVANAAAPTVPSSDITFTQSQLPIVGNVQVTGS